MHPKSIRPAGPYDLPLEARLTRLSSREPGPFPASAALARAIESARPSTDPTVRVQVWGIRSNGQPSNNDAAVPASLLPDVVKTLAEDPEVAYFTVGTRP